MADSTIRTYDPAEVQVIIGAVIGYGYADGTFIKIVRDGNAFEKKRGADGTIDRVNKNATDFSVEFTIKRTSPLNAILAGLLVADQASNAGVFPLTIKDGSGNSLFEAPQAWIEKDPDQEYSDSLGNNTWKFSTGPGVNLIAGN